MCDYTEEKENKGEIKWITIVHRCTCCENCLLHAIALYLSLTGNLAVV